jgi:t-SNARE complex subunit (syntaxin)
MQDHTFTLIVSAVGIGGALSGIVVGHFLTLSSQHRQWVRDNRKQEFKEVVSAMSQYIIEHMSYVASQGSDLPQSKQAYVDSMKAAGVILTDRIYIHHDLDERDIPKRFLEIMEHFRESGKDFDKPADKASALLQEIIVLARKG